MRWDDGAGVLTIGAREGSYPGMVERRTFRIVVVDSKHGIGGEVEKNADKEVAYEGKEIKFSLHLK
jgi:alpha-D-xyloside xylohydrolase